MDIDEILSVPNSNPNLQPKIKDAREMFRYATIFFLIAALLYGLWGIWNFFWGFISLSIFSIMSGIIQLALAVVAIIIKSKFVDDIMTPINQGRCQESKDNLIIYIILGLIFGMFISGILILLGYTKLDEVDLQAKNCPDCRSTLRYVQQYDDWYCDNCDDYKIPVHSAQPSNTPPPGQQQKPPQQQSHQQPPSGQSQPTQQPPQQQQQPSPPPQKENQDNQCPDCNGQMRYINEYNQWYCDNCQEYK